MNSRLTVVVFLVWSGFLVGCGEELEEVEGSREAMSVDTLPGGAIHVQNRAAGSWGREPEWHLDEAVEIGSPDRFETEVFGEIRGLAVDSQGFVYILDHLADEVRVYSPDGSPVRNLGGSGSGPGELARPFGLGIDASDRVWVADQGNNRYTIWDSSGTLVSASLRPIKSWPRMWSGGAGFERTRLVEPAAVAPGSGDARAAFLRLSKPGAAIDTFPRPSSGLAPDVYSALPSDAPRPPAIRPTALRPSCWCPSSRTR